jgi:putative heme-binding domain-containing protein
VGIAGDYKVRKAENKLAEILRDTAVREYVRISALRSLMKIDAGKHAALAGSVLEDTSSKPNFKRDIVAVLSEYPHQNVNRTLASIKNPPPDLQSGIVMALASSGSGKNILFEKVRKGEIFARALAEPKVEERLSINSTPSQQAIYKQLTANLEQIDAEKQSIISGRIADYNNLQEKPDPQTGQTVFVKNCSPCHSLKGQGGAIGPQLDGVGKWGVGPLTEKILDPNRNISENFRTYTLKMKDGKVLSGLYRRDEGQVIVFANAAGQEFSVSKQDIEERKASKYSLMPDQFINSIPVNEFNALISYLLTQKN